MYWSTTHLKVLKKKEQKWERKDSATQNQDSLSDQVSAHHEFYQTE